MDRNPHHHHHHRHHSPSPPPPVTHVHHTSHHPPPPTPSPPHVPPIHHPTPPAPPPPHVPPVYHPIPTPPPPQPHHHRAPRDVYPPPPAVPAPAPFFVPHHHDSLARKPSVRVFCKARTDYSLTIRHGKVILAPNNNSDPHQHWIKDEKYSTSVKDEEGLPAFALINKATGQAMKHSIGATHPVQLIPYNANHLDESVLWTESKDLGDSYKAIRMVNNIRLNVDALNGDKQHGGVFDGTEIVLGEWKKGENQRWKIHPY